MSQVFSIAVHNAAVVVPLAVVVWCVTRLLKSPPAAHVLWLLLLVKLVTPPVVNFEAWTWDSAAIISEGDAPSETGVVATAPIVGVSEAPAEIGPGVIAPRPVSEAMPTPAARDDVRAATSSSAGASFATVWDAVRPVLMWMWIGGTGLAALAAGVRIVRFRRLMGGLLPAPERIRALADEPSARLGLRRTPDVRVAEGGAAPFVWGAGKRATVVLPLRLLGDLDERQTSMVLAHELAHLRRRDHWVRIVELAASVLYWWHPVVWWVRRQLHADEEQCCDAWVAWVYPEGTREYAETLLKASELLPERGRSTVLASPFLRGQTLKERIELVLRNQSRRTMSGWAGALVVLFAVAVIPAGIRGASRGDAAEEKEPSKELVRLKAGGGPKGGDDQKANGTKQVLPEDVQALQGEWRFGLYYSDWWPARITNPPVGWSKWQWTVKGNDIVWSGMKIDDVRLSFKVDPSKSPRQIDLTLLDGPHKGTTLRGMYEFKGGGWWICFAEPGSSVDRPSKVEYGTGEGRTMVILRRAPVETGAGEVPPAKAEDKDHGRDVDAAIGRLRDLGAFVREFYARDDPRYWVQIISTGTGEATRQSAENFDDAAMKDVEIIGREATLRLHLAKTSVTIDGLKMLASARLVAKLVLSGSNVRDEMLKVLPGLPLRGELTLNSNRLTNEGIRAVAECRELISVSLSGAALTDSCLKYLTLLPKLQAVSLGGNFTRGAFKVLRPLDGLISLDASAVTPELSDLKPFRKLKRLSLGGKKYGDDAAEAIAETFTSLEQAYLRDTSIGNAGVEHLARLKTLTVLTLDGSAIDDGAAESIRKMKQLTWLSVANTSAGDETLAAACECPGMWYLDFSNTQITDEGMAHVVKLTKAVTLYVMECKGVTDSSVVPLAKMPDSPSLYLTLNRSGISEKGARLLRKALPHAQISW